MTPERMNEILTKARDQIVGYGLTFQSFSASGMWNPNFDRSAMCLMGSVSWAVTGNPRNLRNAEAREVWSFLQETLSEISELRLIPWNDEKTFRADGTWYFCRTIEEVTDLFDRAIAKV